MPPGRLRRTRRVAVAAAVSVLVVGTLLLNVFPTRAWWDQREEIVAAERELAALRTEQSTLRDERERLQDPSEIENIAREDYGYTYPDEELYWIIPPPEAVLDLPAVWPFDALQEGLTATDATPSTAPTPTGG